MYIDQQFISDIDFFARISEIFSEIIGSIKYYPYPTIVYKIAINKYVNSENIPTPVQEKSKPVISKKEIPEPKIESKKEEKTEEIIQEKVPAIQHPESKVQNSMDGNELLK
jgi:hypothetical protein